MDFKDLQNVVAYLKRFSSCPQCNKKYGEKHLSVMATKGNEAFFRLHCPNCGAEGILMVTTKLTEAMLGNALNQSLNQAKAANQTFQTLPNAGQTLQSAGQTSQFTHQVLSKVSYDDILDIHNFLKNLQGDLSRHLS